MKAGADTVRLALLMSTLEILLVVCLLTPYAARADSAPVPACTEDGRVYKVCTDQNERYESALARAKIGHKLLLVLYGADWCPWCVSMHRLFGSQKYKERLEKDYILAEIGLYKEREKSASGMEVLRKVMALSGTKSAQEGIPLLSLVHPESRRALFIDTAPLEKNTKTEKGHDPEKLFAALEKAKRTLKTQK